MKKTDPSHSGSRPLILIVGDDGHQVADTARTRLDRLVAPEDRAFGLEIVEGQADKIEQALASLRQCLEAIRTVGLLGGGKVVWWRGVNFLGASLVGRNRDVQETLGMLVEQIRAGFPPRHTLLITAPKADARTAFVKLCAAQGELVTCSAPDRPWQRDQAAEASVSRALQQTGIQADQELVRRFVQKVGTDGAQIAQELNKLDLYLGTRRRLRAEDLDVIVSPARELPPWDLEDSVASRDTGRALAVLRQLLFQREEPIRLISGLESRFRQLLLFREALDNGWLGHSPGGRRSQPGEAEAFQAALATEKGKPLHPFVVKKLAEQAAGFTRSELERGRTWLLEARCRMVSSRTPPALLLEALVVNLCRKSPARRAAPRSA